MRTLAAAAAGGIVPVLRRCRTPGRRHDTLGISLLTEEEHFALHKLGEFDTKTPSWIATPADIRERGGKLYGEERYGRIFIGHNGAQACYAARGFRGSLRV